MQQLHLVRVPLALNALARWAGERGWVRGRTMTFDEGRALHHLLTETFGPGTLHPFRLLVPPRSADGNLYAYSANDHEQLRAALRKFALPDHLTVLRQERLASKVMPDSWGVGQRLGFDVRVRPVRRLYADLATRRGRFRAGAELDAFLLEALRRYPDDHAGMATNDRRREAVYMDWLAERLKTAARIDRSATRLVQFQRTLVARPRHIPDGGGQRTDSGIEGPDATFHGTLTVTQPNAFAEVLVRGVGRHCAYGYGMLLLRPPGYRPPVR